MPHGAFALMETREEVNEMLKLDDYINLIIPGLKRIREIHPG